MQVKSWIGLLPENYSENTVIVRKSKNSGCIPFVFILPANFMRKQDTIFETTTCEIFPIMQEKLNNQAQLICR